MVVKTKFGKAAWVGDGHPDHNLHLTLVPDGGLRGVNRRRGFGFERFPAMCGRTYVSNTTWAKAMKARGKKCGNCQRLVPGYVAEGPWALHTDKKPSK